MALLFESSFSFSKPSSRRDTYEDVAPLEDRRDTRSPSPFSSTSANKRLSISDSLYSLPSLVDSSSSIHSSAPLSARLLGADSRRSSLARDYFETIRARRQCAIRQQCDPRRASAIRIYVENLMSEETNYEMHPSSVGMNFPAPMRSAPTSFYQDNSPTSTEDEEDEIEAMKSLTIAEKSNKPRSGSGVAGSSRKRQSVQKSTKMKTKSRARY